MKKKLYIGAIILVALIAALFIFLPIYNGAVCTLSPEKTCVSKLVNLFDYLEYRKNVRTANFLAQMELSRSLFPETIGDYAIAPGNYYATNDCVDIDKEKVCKHDIHVMYRNNITNEVTDLTFITVLLGKHIFMNNQQLFFERAQLEGYDVGYNRDKRFSWFPLKDFDTVVTYEESADNDKVDGTNLVTTYFLEKYPPYNKAVDLVR